MIAPVHGQKAQAQNQEVAGLGPQGKPGEEASYARPKDGLDEEEKPRVGFGAVRTPQRGRLVQGQKP